MNARIGFSHSLWIVVALLFFAPFISGNGANSSIQAQSFIAPNIGTDTTACLPDCFNSPFGTAKLHKILIPGYGWFLVKFRTRYACNTWYDVYIDWIVPLNSNGTDPFNGVSMQYILEIITNFLLKENPMQFPPLPGDPVQCRTNWRVIKGPCWSRTNTGNPQCPIQYIACGEVTCCLEPYQVCINPTTGQRTVTKTSYGWSYYSCGSSPTPAGGQSCEPACGYPAQYNNY